MGIVRYQMHTRLAITAHRTPFTILIEASVRLMNLGSTSPSSPAASNSAASQSDSTVPTN